MIPHPHVRHPFRNLDTILATKVNRVFGSMTAFWVLVFWQLGWMALAFLGIPLFRDDPYPFIFLLFLGNLVQLWALPILGSTTNEADRKHALKADADHDTLTYIAHVLDGIAAKARVQLPPDPEG